MTYTQALARKWRPRTFSQLVGQEHINKALTNALNQQRLHHAYLFTGTRGVGKTSIARILAKSLNCEQGIRSEPCLHCDACLAIEQGRFIDLIEIDGASKTRVEDTRDLLENVHYLPTNGRFKIYLIDEVHMLSQHSFNALLKTLEEPPAHVKFILATTDPQKLPPTILSRCLQFNLKHLSVELIYQQLECILEDEKLEFETEALRLLAQAARGSMRDALSLLDQAITACEHKLKVQEIKGLLGYTKEDYAIQLLQALAQQQAEALLTISEHIEQEGGHFLYVLDVLLTHLHHISVYQSLGDNNPLISPSPEIKRLANEFSGEDLQLFYHIAIKGQDEIHLAPTMKIGFNMVLLRMLTFRPAPKIDIPPLITQSQIPIEAPITQLDSKPLITETTTENKTAVLSTDWTKIIACLQLTGLARNALEYSAFQSREGSTVHLTVSKGHISLFTPSTKSRIEAALSEYYQSSITLHLHTKDSEVETSPALQKKKALEQKQQKAEDVLLQDPLFQQIKQDFSADLIKNSIVLLKDEL